MLVDRNAMLLLELGVAASRGDKALFERALASVPGADVLTDLLEQGDLASVTAHPKFKELLPMLLNAATNPAQQEGPPKVYSKCPGCGLPHRVNFNPT